MTGERQIFRERIHQEVCCPKCNADLVAGSLASYRQAHHWVSLGDLKYTPHPYPRDDPSIYRISFPYKSRNISCLVGGFPRRASIRSALLVHFLHRHVWDMLVVLEEGNYPLPLCPKCYMLVTWWALNGTHQATTMCARGAER